MLTPTLAMTLNSTPTEGTCCQLVTTPQSKSGICVKATFCTPSTVTKDHPHRFPSHPTETTSALVELTQSSWFGRATLMRTNRSLSKISEPRLESQLAFLNLLFPKDQRHPRRTSLQDWSQPRKLTLQASPNPPLSKITITSLKLTSMME